MARWIFSFRILTVTTLLFTLPCLPAYLLSRPLHLFPKSITPRGEAERIIKSLNLLDRNEETTFRRHKKRTVENRKIVEWKVSLKIEDTAYGGLVSTEELGAHAGFFQLNRTQNSRMFYFFFESRGNKAEDLLLLWMTGGPGCGSEIALFYENGPFTVSEKFHLHWNRYGWDNVANMIFVDQPIGTGFSYTTDFHGIRQDKQEITRDIYDFIQAFLESHPDYRGNDLFLTGESYAGHYIPALASHIYKANRRGSAAVINLKGFAIGNGLTHPNIQYESYADYALMMGLIEKNDHDRITRRYPVCQESVKMCENEGGVTCMAAYLACNRILDGVLSLLGNTNYYDIRKECEGTICYNFSTIEQFLNQLPVQQSLGVVGYTWVACSSLVYDAMMMDWMRNDEVEIPSLLEDGIKMLIYAGEFDVICNWLGNFRWLEAMHWSGQQSYIETPLKNFIVNGQLSGAVRSYGPVTFLKVYNAGHMVPMDQPKIALEMIWRWTRGLELASQGSGQRLWQASSRSGLHENS